MSAWVNGDDNITVRIGFDFKRQRLIAYVTVCNQLNFKPYFLGNGYRFPSHRISLSKCAGEAVKGPQRNSCQFSAIHVCP